MNDSSDQTADYIQNCFITTISLQLFLYYVRCFVGLCSQVSKHHIHVVFFINFFMRSVSEGVMYCQPSCGCLPAGTGPWILPWFQRRTRSTGEGDKTGLRWDCFRYIQHPKFPEKTAAMTGKWMLLRGFNHKYSTSRYMLQDILSYFLLQKKEAGNSRIQVFPLLFNAGTTTGWQKPKQTLRSLLLVLKSAVCLSVAVTAVASTSWVVAWFPDGGLLVTNTYWRENRSTNVNPKLTLQGDKAVWLLGYLDKRAQVMFQALLVTSGDYMYDHSVDTHRGRVQSFE